MFSPEGPRENVWWPHENVSPGPAVALDGPAVTDDVDGSRTNANSSHKNK